ncbi:MAG: DUF362 domain-containing protein [Bradymonadaceae bacterium]|nr:DUF362 domain-containing protein [Lujinxingiaceae bacterium]
MKKPTVILRHCADYDAERIERIVGEGLDTMGLRPFGRTLVKPNVVASGPLFPHAYTRPEFVEGVLRALKSRGERMTEIAVGERCGITVPTRFAYKGAGYYEMIDRVGGTKLYHFDEEPQVEIPLFHPQRLRDSFFTPEPVARADFFVNCPKFKAHPWTTVTFSMKNYIGIQDDRHRLIDHDHALNSKVADLQYITQPQFIATDAIIAGEGRMLTPRPYRLDLVCMGDNQVAFDAVCCHIIGVDPLSVDHIRMAHERGFGPVDLASITILGDVSLAEARERAQHFEVGLIRVEDYFEDTNIRAYAGPPPSDTEKYCWGGCPGALEEAIEILRVFDAATDEKMPRMHVVFGAYDGDIDAKPGEKVVFMGDCATYKGEIAGRDVSIESRYIDRARHDPKSARTEDIYAKMARMEKRMWEARKDDVIQIKGCPVSVAEQVLLLVKIGKLQNPYFDPSQAMSFTSCYLSSRTRTAIKRIFGESYHKSGPTVRGAARPVQNMPPGD